MLSDTAMLEEMEDLHVEDEDEAAAAAKDDSVCCFKGHSGVVLWSYACTAQCHLTPSPTPTTSQGLSSQCLCIHLEVWFAVEVKTIGP